MSEFLDILTHGRRLQGAVKELSLEELSLVAEKLGNIIEARKVKEAEKIKAEQEKNDKLNAIKKQLEDAGLDIDDLQSLEGGKKSKRSGQKRPVKYILVDDEGNEHPWTGIGRMPKVYSQALAAGKMLDSFKV